MSESAGSTEAVVGSVDLAGFDGHTPGDWTWRQDGQAAYVEGPNLRVGKWLVAHVDGRGARENYANAKLVAAAPTLLAEVRTLRAERDALRGALTMAEWEGGWVIDIGGDTTSSCPVCGFAETTGHARTCEIARALSHPPATPTPANEP